VRLRLRLRFVLDELGVEVGRSPSQCTRRSVPPL